MVASLGGEERQTELEKLGDRHIILTDMYKQMYTERRFTDDHVQAETQTDIIDALGKLTRIEGQEANKCQYSTSVLAESRE